MLLPCERTTERSNERTNNHFEKVEKISSEGIVALLLLTRLKSAHLANLVISIRLSCSFCSELQHSYLLTFSTLLSLSLPLKRSLFSCFQFRTFVSRRICRQSKLIFYFPFGGFILRSQSYRSLHLLIPSSFCTSNFSMPYGLCWKCCMHCMLNSVGSFANMFALSVLAFIEEHFKFVWFGIFKLK